MGDDTPLGLTVSQYQKLLQAINESVYRGSGFGSYYGRYQSVLSGINKHGHNPLPNNSEVHGYVFITRPKLNLTTTSVRQHRVLNMLDTLDPNSLSFMIRCLLDTNFAKVHNDKALVCPFLEQRSPFIIPLSNSITDISGYPDYVIDTETTDGGYFSEDQTTAVGSDRLARTYDLNLNVREIQGGINMTLLFIWALFQDLVTRGEVVAYPEDIRNNRLCYTSSIYNFVLDPTTTVITKWSKATGCFPVSVPWSNIFNKSSGERFIQGGINFSIPFKVNHIGYMDPIILKEFNIITERYWPALANPSSLVDVGNDAKTNYIGLPHIDLAAGFNQLKWYELKANLIDPDEYIEKILSSAETS